MVRSWTTQSCPILTGPKHPEEKTIRKHTTRREWRNGLDWFRAAGNAHLAFKLLSFSSHVKFLKVRLR